MRPQHDFIPERGIANHCAELFAIEPSSDERAKEQAEEQTVELEAFSVRAQRAMQAQLAAQLGGDKLRVSAEEVGRRKAGSLYKAIGTVAANLLLECGTGKLPLLLSFDYGAALALTEQAFGGDVRGIETGLTELPQSAWLVLESIAAQIAQSFAEACEMDGGCELLRHHENVAKVDAFPKRAACFVWPVSFHLPGTVEIPFRLVTSEPDFLGIVNAGAQDDAPTVAAIDPALQSAVFGGLPLPMRAVLADLAMPVSQLASLKPGDCIPFSPRREVPLMMGTKVIARGRIGSLDEEVALNVTQLI